MLINMLFITLIWVIVLDILGFYDEFMGQILKWIYRNDIRGIPEVPHIKPFSCSTCMTFWSCLAYILAIGQVTIPSLLLCTVFALSTNYIVQIYYALDTIITKLLNKVYGK